MFEMGFEPQVRSIVKNVRPDRQTLLFSATFKRRIENLARDALTNPVRITVRRDRWLRPLSPWPHSVTRYLLHHAGWRVWPNQRKRESEGVGLLRQLEEVPVACQPRGSVPGGRKGGSPGLACNPVAATDSLRPCGLASPRQLLIFVNKKEGAETLANHLNEDLHNRAGRPSATPGFATTAPKVFLSIHGNKSQHERTDVIRKVCARELRQVVSPVRMWIDHVLHLACRLQFKKGIAKGLVATDVAARGLDIKVCVWCVCRYNTCAVSVAPRVDLAHAARSQDIRTVVNFDAAMRIETHVHRCGRTGRMGVDGTDIGNAHTLVTHKEFNFAADLVNNLRVSGQVRRKLEAHVWATPPRAYTTRRSCACSSVANAPHAPVAGCSPRVDRGCQAQQALPAARWAWWAGQREGRVVRARERGARLWRWRPQQPSCKCKRRPWSPWWRQRCTICKGTRVGGSGGHAVRGWFHQRNDGDGCTSCVSGTSGWRRGWQ